jgi:hypothetical protein
VNSRFFIGISAVQSDLRKFIKVSGFKNLFFLDGGIRWGRVCPSESKVTN